MAVFSRIRYLYLAYFSKPVCDRALYRTVVRKKVQRILEIGIGSSDRTLRLIALAQRGAGGEAIRYTAVDMFEARPKDQKPGLSLKDAHRVFKATEAQVQLIPGDPAGALARSANALANMDLVIISADMDDAALEPAWFYLPRMLHANSAVYRHRLLAGQPTLEALTPSQVEALAKSGRRRKAA